MVESVPELLTLTLNREPLGLSKISPLAEPVVSRSPGTVKAELWRRLEIAWAFCAAVKVSARVETKSSWTKSREFTPPVKEPAASFEVTAWRRNEIALPCVPVSFAVKSKYRFDPLADVAAVTWPDADRVPTREKPEAVTAPLFMSSTNAANHSAQSPEPLYRR